MQTRAANPVIYNTYRCFKGNNLAVFKTAEVNLRQTEGRLALLQDAGYRSLLKASGFFNLEIEHASIGEAFRLGVLPEDSASGMVGSDNQAEMLSDSLRSKGAVPFFATSANEAPRHWGQFTFSENDPWEVSGRDFYAENAPQRRVQYYCLVDTGTKIEFRDLLFGPKIDPLEVLKNSDSSLPFRAVVSGKPLIWEGKPTSLRQYLYPMLSDLRHFFNLPSLPANLGGIPIGRYSLQEMILNGDYDLIASLLELKEPLTVDVEKELEAAIQMGTNLDLCHLATAAKAMPHMKVTNGGTTISFALHLGHYRHTVWALLDDGTLLSGFVSAPSNADGVTWLELQEQMRQMGAVYAIAFGAGKDNRLYHLSDNPETPNRFLRTWHEGLTLHKEIDLDAVVRYGTPSGLLALIGKV